jgi:hypothetical protein
MTTIIDWATYGYTKVGPKHLADPKRFEHFPSLDRHCNDTGQLHRLAQTNHRMASRLFNIPM